MASRNIVFTGSVGLTPGTGLSAQRNPVFVGHVGLTFSGKMGSVRGIVNPSSVGLTILAFTPLMGRAIIIQGSIGLSATAVPNLNYSAKMSGSIGLSGPATISRLYSPIVSGSIGLSFAGSLRLNYIRGFATGSVGLSFTGRPWMNRAARMGGSIGLSSRVTASIIPVLKIGAVVLVEIQDGPSLATFGSLTSREYQNLVLDKTTLSYPQPFKLLN